MALPKENENFSSNLQRKREVCEGGPDLSSPPWNAEYTGSSVACRYLSVQGLDEAFT